MAKNYLGVYNYEKGNLKGAVHHFKDATKNYTCERALANLAQCFEVGVEGEAEQDHQQAIRLYEKSASMGFFPAIVGLAKLLYKKGKEEENEEFAENYFFKC